MNFHKHTHSSNCNKPEMAEFAVEAAVQMLLEKLFALAAEEIELFRGFKNDLERLDKTLKKIQIFLNDASKRDIEKEHSVKLWLYELEDVAYEADNLLDEFNYEILRRKVEIESQVKRKVCCSFSLCFPGHVAFRPEMGHKIKDLNAKLKTVNDEAESLGLQARLAVLPDYVPPVMETNSITVDPIFIGRDGVASQIVDDIIKCSNELEVSVVPIVGMGGLGKTTLARKVFNNQSIEKHFNERIWVSVSKKIDNKSLLIKVLESLSKESVGESLGEEPIIQKLRSKLKDKRYLLVLDDCLDDEKHVWDCFRNCVQGINSSKGNFIIVTTRHQNVVSTATTLGKCSLPVLSDDDCWEIIKERTFRGLQVPEEFEAIGKEIACRCGGLPLAANVAGGSLQGKGSDYWRSFLESSNSNPNDDVVLQVLKVSFHRLPSSLHKKCFAYCSIFPKGEEIWRERLIQLWMAEGFLFGSSEKSDMESCGDDVYHFLLQNFFLHEAVKDKYGRIKYSKMHDLVHDLSCLVAGVDRDDEENVISRVRYLAVDDKHGIKKEQATYLRTLILKGGHFINNKFLDCKYLHALDLQRTGTEKLTSSIDKLIHLRFLDLSYNYSIKRLPDSVCKLFNLQTIRLVNCRRLIELPDRFKLLVGLRHLVLYDDFLYFRRMPLEIGKLTSLRTLEFFIVGNEEGRRIGELRNLKNLRGNLVIRNLEEVRDKEEAMGANLVEKQNLESLEFKWSLPPFVRKGSNNDYEVLEGLQPHRNLKSLEITNFDGDNFPPWTIRMALPNLIKIVLSLCENCQEMPTLGHLPFLKILEVSVLRNVRSIGPSFYQNGDEESSRSGVAFPELELLQLLGMDNLTKWVEAPNTGATAFPKLEHLVISDCSKLMTAPSHAFPSLRKLKICGVESEVPLTKICSNSDSLEQLFIGGISNLTSLPDTLFYNNRCLRSLEIGGCNKLRQLELSDALKSLGVLRINGCSNLASIQCQTTDYLKGISPLWRLEIRGCPMLAGFPSEIMPKNLDNGMDCLKTLEIGPFSEETGMNETLKGLRELQSLRELVLYGKPQWESLPDQLQHLTALTDLRLNSFGMEALPEWFSNMSSLNSLVVYRCDKLMDLSCLQHLTKLKSLHFKGCTLIRRETWTDPSSSVAQRTLRAHISHIPDILVNLRKIHFQ